MQSGLVKTLDKTEEKLRGAGDLVQLVGPASFKKEYGKHNDINTTDVGYAAAKQNKATAEQSALIASDKASALAAQNAADAAALEKRQSAQVDALKRKGRRASILTSSSGVQDPLGSNGLPGSETLG